VPVSVQVTDRFSREHVRGGAGARSLARRATTVAVSTLRVRPHVIADLAAEIEEPFCDCGEPDGPTPALRARKAADRGMRFWSVLPSVHPCCALSASGSNASRLYLENTA